MGCRQQVGRAKQLLCRIWEKWEIFTLSLFRSKIHCVVSGKNETSSQSSVDAIVQGDAIASKNIKKENYGNLIMKRLNVRVIVN